MFLYESFATIFETNKSMVLCVPLKILNYSIIEKIYHEMIKINIKKNKKKQTIWRQTEQLKLIHLLRMRS